MNNNRNVPYRNGSNNYNANQLGGGYSPMDIDNVETGRDYSYHICYGYGKRGHIKSQCRQGPENKHKSNVGRDENQPLKD